MTLRFRLQKAASWMRRKARYKTLNSITLDRSAVINNIRIIKEQHRGSAVIPVLKGNAYGHGLREIAEILNDADIGLIAVDGYFEAGKIRHVSRHKILVLGYILPVNARLLDTRRCSFVVQDIAGLDAFGRLKRPVSVHLELNTGMNRLGLATDEIDSYLDKLRSYPTLELEGIMSHLADADNPDDESWITDQTVRFDAAVKHIVAAGFAPKYIHIAQTAGSVKVKSSYANAIRLGLGLYGINPLLPSDPSYEHLQGLQPVLTLRSTIIKTIDLAAGDRVSYNGIFTTASPMRIGVMPLGYYEGVPRELSNAGQVLYGKTPLPIIGRVNMNHTMIDLRDTGASVGDEVTIISAGANDPNSVAAMRSNYKLFPYLVLTKLSSTIRRRVV